MLRRFSALLVLLAVWTAAYANGPVLWAPAPGGDAPSATVRLTARFDMPAASMQALPPPPAGVRGALARLQKGETIVWCGWTSSGWEELAGAEAGPEAVEVTMTFAESAVAYAVNGRSLVAARTGVSALPCGPGTSSGGTSAEGEGRLFSSSVCGGCFDATNALAAAGGRVTVTEGTPDGTYPLVSANAAAWRQDVTVEGPRDRVCTLASNGADGLDVTVASLPYDEGRYILAFTVAADDVGFARNLADDLTGSDHMLFLNGGGRLVLLGENEISGGVVVEDGLVETHETKSSSAADVLLWSDTAFLLSEKVDRLELVERVTTVEDPMGLVVRKVAFSPVLETSSGGQTPFVVSPPEDDGAFRTVTFRIGNATRGFVYSCGSASEPTGDFTASAARVTADRDGELVLTVRVPANESRRFFRLCVDFPR